MVHKKLLYITDDKEEIFDDNITFYVLWSPSWWKCSIFILKDLFREKKANY
jgi:hypothetical protein